MGFRWSITLPVLENFRWTGGIYLRHVRGMASRYPVERVGRKHPASGVRIDLGEPTIVFLTVNTRDGTPWLAQPLIHDLLCETWNEAQAWLVGYYLLMPDHLHLFCAPHDLNFTLDTWVTYWKSQFKRKLNAHLAATGRMKLPPNPNQPGRVRVLSNPIQKPEQGETIRVPPERHPPTDVTDFPKRHVSGGEVRVRRGSHRPLVGDPATFRWQEGKAWDTRLRRSESYAQKWQYVRENPMRKGLAVGLDDWPYQGMLHELRW